MAESSTTPAAEHSEPADSVPAQAHGGAGAHGHGEIHLPPNSWSPISLAFALTAAFIGLIVGAWLWIPGLIWTLASLALWFRAARREFEELPD
jgi:hypothetical protein